jgi:uncharacterized secreted protein with C-terminal beta-propeller domain
MVTLALVALLTSVAWLHADGSRRGSRRATLPEAPEHVALQAYAGCEDLRSYMSDVVLETVLQCKYHFICQNWWRPWDENPWSVPGTLDNGGVESPTDYTSTNVQEQGVDEVDFVKTDGDYIYVVHSGKLLIVKSWPAADSEIVATVNLWSHPSGLFLFDDYVLVFSSFSQGGKRFAWGTRLDMIDVSDRHAPAIVRSIEVEGSMVGARMIDGHVYVILSTDIGIPDAAWQLIHDPDLGLPEVSWDDPQDVREAAAEVARGILQPYIDELVTMLNPEDLIPLMRDRTLASPFPETERLLECSDIYRPAKKAEYSVLSVLHFDLGSTDPELTELDGTGLLANGMTVYASSENLYLAQSSRWSWWGRGDLERTSAIHKFELTANPEQPVRYLASGEIRGWLLNQFSMGEHEGYLRVATTEFDWWWGGTEDEEDQGSLVSVLADNHWGELIQVGQVSGIAPGERIYATRFLGDKGYLVTFVQVDPLFTLDLSDPTNPQVVGELKIPGYSAYLHPVDEGHLLAVGMHGDDLGRLGGLAVNLFDVSDFANPILAHQYIIGDEQGWSWSEALSNHHAFTFHRDVLSIPAYLGGGEEGFSGLLVFDIDIEAGIEELGRVEATSFEDCWLYSGRCSASMRRSIYIEDYLYALSTAGIKVNELLRPDVEVAAVWFHD